MDKIADNIYYENGYSGVTLGAMIFPLGTIMIDAPLRAEDGRSWRNALSEHGDSANRLLINLDAHPDRTLGARMMDCTIIAHQKTAQVFRSRPSIFKGVHGESGSDWESYDDAVGTRWAAPDVTFTQNAFLHWGENEIILEHHPGPTPGAIWVTVPATKVIFVGDAVVYEQTPFLANADIPIWLENLNLLLKEFKHYTIVSGRGGPVPFEAIKTQKEHLQILLKGMEKIAKYKTPVEATEDLIPDLLTKMKLSKQLEEQYVQRLRHGLAQYYTRHYRPNSDANAIE